MAKHGANVKELTGFQSDKRALQQQFDDMKSKFDQALSAEKKIKELNRQLEFQVEELMEQLNTADDARKSLKGELSIANDKIIQIEEELYGAKTIQKDLLDKLKESEDA